MKRRAIATGVIACIGIALFIWFLPAPAARTEHTTRTESVVLRGVIEQDDARVDMYLPAASTRPAPWIIFATEREGAGDAAAMQRRGIAVGLLSLGTKEQRSSPLADERIADIVRELERRANTYGLLPRPILAGDRGGASLIVRVALDARFGLEPAQIGGVVAISGIYDSLLQHARADAPPFLVLSSHSDSPEATQGARSFARALTRSGATVVRSYHVAARAERPLGDLSGERNDVADLVASFVRAEPAPAGPESIWAIVDAWGRDAPLSTEPFWTDERLVVRHAVDDPFRADIGRVFASTMHDLDPWPRKTYDAISLVDYLGAHPELGVGDWLIVTNARGEQIVLSRGEIQREKPVVVIGLDDERNLFRLLVTYNVYRDYTFKPDTEPRALLVRPVGAFLHFPSAPATEPRSATFANFALTPASFRVVAADPLASARVLPKTLVRTLTGEQGCLQCHSLRGAGARSRHLRALDGKLTGGEALALEAYPREVMQRFLFEQDEIAKIFGVAPIRVLSTTAGLLLAEVSR